MRLKKHKLYKVVFSYYKEDKKKPTQSSGGMETYHVSASSASEAKHLGTKKFERDFDDYELDSYSATAKVIKLPKFVVLTGSGVLQIC